MLSDTGAFRVLKDLSSKSPFQPSFNRTSWMNSVFRGRVGLDAGNLPPMAKDDVVNAATVRPVAGGLPQAVVKVLLNDSDLDKDPLTVVAVGTAKNGTVTIDPTGKQVVYQASSAQVKNDAFTYTVSDGRGGTAVGQVVIRTNPAGRYSGSVVAGTNPTSGDAVGALQIAMNPDRSLSARLDLGGRAYRFTGRLNEVNQCAAVLLTRPNGSESLAVQLTLRPGGAITTVEAAIQQNNQAAFSASCTLVPR